MMASTATAQTVAPVTFLELLRQRVRWNTGHLQCSLYHMRSLGSHLRFDWLIYPTFVLGTVSYLLGFACIVFVLATGETAILGMTWLHVSIVCLVLIYTQRLAAAWVLNRHSISTLTFILEPIIMATIYLISLGGAVLALTSKRPTRWRA